MARRPDQKLSGKGAKAGQERIVNKKYITLDQHERVGKTLHTPWTAYKNASPSSWSQERLPEMLWVALLVSRVGRDQGLATVRVGLSAVVSNLRRRKPRPDITHTGMSFWSPKVRRAFLGSICAEEAARAAMAPLLALSRLPARSDWVDHLPGIAPAEAWDFLARAAGKAFYHRSELATDCRWARVAFQLLTGGIRLSDASMRKELLEYPGFGEPERVSSLLRATEQAIDGLHDLGRRAWPEEFWAECMTNTRCLRREPETKAAPDSPISAEKLVDAVIQVLEHWRTTARTTGIDARHDGVMGTALYAMQLLMECSGGVVRHSNLGRMGLRAILECYVHLAYLLHMDDAALWLSYRRYGCEQAKLSYLHLDKLGEDWSYVTRESLEAIANEDQWQDLLPVELGHWAKLNLRVLAEKAGVKDDYARFYSWTSEYVHGHWGAARSAMYEACVNPLHRLHRAPRIPATRHGDVVPDAAYLVQKILDLAEKAYPGLGLRLDIWESGEGPAVE